MTAPLPRRCHGSGVRIDRSVVDAPASSRAATFSALVRRLIPVWALTLVTIAGLAACGGGDATEVDVERLERAFESADVTLGSEVFGDSCSVCHGSDGSGGVGAALGGVSERLTVRDHLSVVWTGRGSMPPFGGLLTDAEIAAVVAYQRSTFGTE